MNNMNSKNLDALLSVVSRKLNMNPAELKTQLEEGKFDTAMKNMNSSDAQKFQSALNNPKLVEQLMSAPQAQQLYKKLTGEK